MKQLIILLTLFIFITGCSTKNVYKPESISGGIDYDGKISSRIVDTSRDGAVLEDGSIISKDGDIVKLGLDESQKYIAKVKDGFLIADGLGSIALYDAKGNKKELYKFDAAVASAMVDNDFLAAVLADNKITLIDLKTNEVVFTKQNSSSYANSSKIANPYFFSSLLVFPTLDGKLEIFDLRSNQIIKTIIVSSSKLFANVIFLDVINDYLVAASSEKVISISPQRIFQKNYDVRDVVFVDNGVYILTKDGQIILCNSQLEVLKSRKFKFADFVGLIYGDFIYAVEKEGYLIALDKSLISVNTYELPSKIDSFMFTTNSGIYVDDKYFKLNVGKK